MHNAAYCNYHYKWCLATILMSPHVRLEKSTIYLSSTLVLEKFLPPRNIFTIQEN